MGDSQLQRAVIIFLEEFLRRSLMELMDHVNEFTTTQSASALLVKCVGKREEQPTEFFLMGLHRHVAQGALDSLWHLSHDRTSLLARDNLPLPRPYDLPCVQMKSPMIWTTLAPKVGFKKSFWHKRLQCKSYQRQPAAAAGSGSAADAGGSQVRRFVRRGARAERRGLLFPRPPLASLHACGCGSPLPSIDPANSTGKRTSSCVPSGNTSTTSPMMKLHGNHQRRCNGDTPVTMTTMIPRANTSVAATRGGKTIAPRRSCRRTCTSCHSVHTVASTSTP